MKNVTDRQKKERARRKAMGIALIQRPLRYIREKTDRIERNVEGIMVRIASERTILAERCAKRGDGGAVKAIARGC